MAKTYKLSDVFKALEAQGIEKPSYSSARKLTHDVLGFTTRNSLDDSSSGFDYDQEQFDKLLAACRIFTVIRHMPEIKKIIEGDLDPAEVQAHVENVAKTATWIASNVADDARLLAANAAA